MATRKRALLAAPEPPTIPTNERPTSALRTTADRLRAAVHSHVGHLTRRQFAGIMALVVLVVGTLSYGLTRPAAPVPLTQREVDAAVAKGIENERKAQAAKPPEGEAVYAAIVPSVVLITTDTDSDGVVDGSGAGTVVKEDGTILTALHVVHGAAQITVRFRDGTESKAALGAVDPTHDLAFLLVARPPDLVVPAVLGGGARVGDPVYAVGHPLGLTMSMSAGVVSATGRVLTPKKGPQLIDMIQFDTAVNPGNSGGPLVNRSGQVVGVVSSLANPSDSPYFIGIGFAAPLASAGGGAASPPH